MGQPAPARPAPSGTAIAIVVGGALAAIGGFLPWFKASFSFSGGNFAGVELPSVSESTTAAGTSDWTGILALVCGVLALGGGVAAIIGKDANVKKTGATLAAVMGILVVVLAVIGFLRAEDVAGSEEISSLQGTFGLQGLEVDTGGSFGLYLSAVGGLVAAVAGFMTRNQAAGSGGTMPGMAPPPPPAPGV